ncbi:GH1 family beta-glucosidase [Arenicella xantha]|uniref:Beta-glucosidase n=1 Tax=Arenicella xantha TaxID=644221 RepID=A0A395JJG2_9GAMM|nr:GH1 family beta-glucosidase [Arenicella xantha]RBP50862.1 beta-glucosidase/beta-glucosidase [Arenicella xantha]
MSLINRFPDDFIWGTATSAYQIEGGANQGGRGRSIWDAFCDIPGNVVNGDSGEQACDHFHRFAEDVKLMANMGVGAYRFSISWPRLLPNGTRDNVNQAGIDFYNRLIDCCLSHGIQPWVTLYHWDLPDDLQTSDGGWMGEKTSGLFADYAQLCFEQYGDRVKHWITINEAWVVSVLGHGQGVFAPGHSSNSEPYQVAHNLLLAHGKAVKIYREQFQSTQGGVIGITNNCDWREPLTNDPQDHAAAQRALEFFLGWFADPIYLGDYPQAMRDKVADRLPEMTPEHKALIQGSSDFFGLNHYTTMLASESDGDVKDQNVYGNGGLSEDQGIDLTVDKDWEKTDMQWAVVPWGCRKLLEWIAARYDNPALYITENGCAYDDELVDGSVNDQRRIDYYASYLEECANAIDNGVNLKGYFAWSLLDNFEWAQGYQKRFGLHHVDFKTFRRTPKNSALWFSKMLKRNLD